jgi:hypothetical protein
VRCLPSGSVLLETNPEDVVVWMTVEVAPSGATVRTSLPSVSYTVCAR